MSRRGLLALLLALPLLAPLIRAETARIEFATAEITGQGVQAVRLNVDTSGPAREAALSLQAPDQTRFLRAIPARVPVGAGAPPSTIFHLVVSERVPAGALEVRGVLRDGSVDVPLTARTTVRSAPGFRVRAGDSNVLVGLEGKPVETSVLVQNTGNTPLQIQGTAPTGDEGPVVILVPAQFRLAPGGQQRVTVTLRAPERAGTTTEHAVACLFSVKSGGYEATEQALVRAVFAPRLADPGRLFATLDGGVEVGGAVIDHRGRYASQLFLAGEIQPALKLEVHAVDGVTSSLGSQLGLARRDTWHVGLEAPAWHATAGEARAPSLGFLEPVFFGRGLEGGVVRDGYTSSAFALRESFGGLVREAAGLKFAGPTETWEAGLLFQRSRQPFVAEAKRTGLFVGRFWQWRELKGQTQAAAAVPDGGGVKPGFAQSVAYQKKEFRLDGRYERAADGFFLRDQSSESRSVMGEWLPGGKWTVFGGAEQSTQTGRLRTLLREQDDLGRPQDPAEVLELINQVATRQKSVRGGLGREFSAGTLRSDFKHQTRAGEFDEKREFAEDVWDLEWTSRSSEPWWRLGSSVGRETGNGKAARFAEFQSALNWSPTTRTRLDANVRWTTALSGKPEGFRRAGVYGQVTASYRPAPTWSMELRADGYDYKDYASRTKLGAVVTFPLGRHGWTGAAEWARVTRTGETASWLVIKMPLAIKMPWRPIRGAVGGRIVDRVSGEGLANVMVQSGRQMAVTNQEGRYQLPAMTPGTHPLRFQIPGRWTAGEDWPATVKVEAGRRDALDLAAVKLAVLAGEVVLTNQSGQTRPAPAGVLVAVDGKGRTHETLAFNGGFNLSLPPGRYRLKYASDLPEEIARQLVAEIEVANEGTTKVKLEAREQERRLRRTLGPTPGPEGKN